MELDLAVGRRGESALGRQLHGALGVDVVEAEPGGVLVGAEAPEVRLPQRRAARLRRRRLRVRRRRRRRLARHEVVVLHVAHRARPHDGDDDEQRERQRLPVAGHASQAPHRALLACCLANANRERARY